MKRMILVISAGLLALVAALLGLLAITRASPAAQELSQLQFVEMVQSNLVARLRVSYPPQPGQVGGVPVMLQEVRGTFYQTYAAGQVLMERGLPRELPFHARVHLTSDLEMKLTTKTNFSVVSPNPYVEKVRGWLRRSK